MQHARSSPAAGVIAVVVLIAIAWALLASHESGVDLTDRVSDLWVAGIAWLVVAGLFVVLLSRPSLPLAVAVVVPPVLAVVVALMVPLPDGHLVAVFYLCLVATAAALWAIALQFSGKTLRLVAGLVLVGLLLLVVRIGRVDLHEHDLAASRGMAQHLDHELREASEANDRQLEAAEQTADDALSALKRSLPPAAKPKGLLVDEGRPVLEALQKENLKAAHNAISQLQREHDALENLTLADSQLMTAAKAAVDAVAAARQQILARTDLSAELEAAQESVTELCRSAAGSMAQPSVTHEATDVCVADDKVAGAGERMLAVKRATADRDVKSLQAKITGDEDDQAAATEAEEALAAARIASAAPPSRRAVPSLIAQGGNRLAVAFPALKHSEIPAIPEPAGWTIVAVLGLLGYGLLERRATRDDRGPVDIKDIEVDEPTPNGDGPGTKALSGQLRMHVLNNVPEPAAVPGATQEQQITNLFEAAGGTSLKFVGPVLQALRGALTPARTYTVSAIYVAPIGTDEKDEKTKEKRKEKTKEKEKHGVIVEVSPQGRPDPSAHARQEGDSAELAVRAAGYWAAGWLLSRSGKVSPWARWSEDTAKALALWHDPSDDAIENFEEAARIAPDSGLVLTKLGYRYDLAGRHRDALVCYLRAAILYPRFVTARYRVAVSFSLLASDVNGHWWSAPADERNLIHRLVQDLVGEDAVLPALTPPPAGGNREAIRALARLSDRMLEDLSGLLERRTVLENALRYPDERKYWLDLLRRGQRDRVSWIVKSARLASLKRANDPTEPPSLKEEVEREATLATTSWQVLYNLACYYAIDARLAGGEGSNHEEAMSGGGPDRGAALGWLERTLTRPGTYQLTAAWLQQDPDLASLRDHPRFKRLVRSLPPDEKATP